MKYSKIIYGCGCYAFLKNCRQRIEKKPVDKTGAGPTEMPADAKTIIISDEEKFRKMIGQINETIDLKFEENYKNGDVFITLDGKPQLMYKAKCNDKNVDRKLIL